jgi:hypothetical protein
MERKSMWVQVCRGPLTFLSDETLPNFKKRKHPRKQEKKKQRARTKVQASRQPREACHREVREPLSIETSISCMKHIN